MSTFRMVVELPEAKIGAAIMALTGIGKMVECKPVLDDNGSSNEPNIGRRPTETGVSVIEAVTAWVKRLPREATFDSSQVKPIAMKVGGSNASHYYPLKVLLEDKVIKKVGRKTAANDPQKYMKL